MKKYFEYIALLSLTVFSFYYTDKVTSIVNSKSPLMIEIKKYNEANKISCKEGYITSEGVVLGSSGKEVDLEESYSNMQGGEFIESKLVFNEITCKINEESTKGSYIISGNESKNMVSIFIKVTDLSLLDEIIKIGENNNIKLNIIVNGMLLEDKLEYFKLLSEKGHEIVYEGFSETDLNKFINNYKEISKKDNYCITTNDSIKECELKKLNILKAKNIYNMDIYSNTKNNLEKGSFYVYYENQNTLKELNSLLKYIKNKQLEIVCISELLK